VLIYIAVNRVNQKAYVGQTTTSFRRRIREHIKGGDRQVFDRAIKKYGRDSFDFGVLQRCSSRAELNEAEREWIKRIGSVSPAGYNIAHGGGGCSGVPMKEEHKARLREMRLGQPAWNAGMKMGPQWATPELIEKRRAGMKARYAAIPHHMNGKTLSDEIRAKQSATHIANGTNVGPKNGMFGKPSPRRGTAHTEEAKAKNRAAAIARWANPETRATLMRSTIKGRPWSVARRAAQEARRIQ